MSNITADTEAKRLEQLWGGEFGIAYNERNKEFDKRRQFWDDFFSKHTPQSVLEVGCNMGGNLRHIQDYVSSDSIYGIDINADALKRLKSEYPALNVLKSQARSLPFKDELCELVFTAGVLIHQPESSIKEVMAEMYRCSSKYIMCMEYFAEQTEEVLYHNQEGALFRRNYGKLFQEMYPDLTLIDTGYLTKEEGWDRVTFWIFEK